ncbi:MAG: DUF2200 domain-containing protein [Erysipelotrichales bacterium]|nr:DUF2200 domain-containing protein [Erysipelotrichales bacterium]
MSKPKIYTMGFSKVYPLYVQKAQKKKRTQEEVDQIICWLTNYTLQQLQQCIDDQIDLETFFTKATINKNANLIKGVVCGVRVEDIKEDTMRYIRYLDKLIDELAKGKAMDKILRGL